MIEKTQTIVEERNGQEIEVYREHLSQMRSDFANYKKRVEKEKEDRTRLSNEELIGKILPVLDDFERAIGTDTSPEASDEWMKGIILVEHNLRSILEGEGLERIDPTNEEFDPEEHEAIFIEEGSEKQQGKIKQVIKPGYRLHEKLIRPAQVSVVKGVKKEPQPKPVRAELETNRPVVRQNIPIRKGNDIGWRGVRAAPRTRGMFV